MELEQIFDKVEERLRDRTGRAFVGIKPSFPSASTTRCVYENKDGLRCAVGIFLPDNEEMLNFDSDVIDLCRDFSEHPEFPKFINKNLFLLSALQGIHDMAIHWNGNIFNALGTKALNDLKEQYLGKIE